MSNESVPAMSLRERTRLAMRNEVAAVALRLFAERGFGAVTTTQIAAAAGISPRSFFRYFPTKDDVLLSGIHDAGLRVQAALEARPADESPWNALRHALRVLIDEPAHPRGYLPMIAQISRDAPSIRAREIEKHQQWEELLVPDLARRLRLAGQSGPVEPEERARVLVGAALSCLTVATGLWLQQGADADPIAILDDLISTVNTA